MEKRPSWTRWVLEQVGVPLFPMIVAATFWKLGSGDFSEVWWSNELPVMALSTLVPAWMDVERLSRLGWFDPHLKRKAGNRAKVGEQLSAATEAARWLVGGFAVMAIVLTTAYYGEKFHVAGFKPEMPAKKQMCQLLALLVSSGIFVRGYVRHVTGEP